MTAAWSRCRHRPGSFPVLFLFNMLADHPAGEAAPAAPAAASAFPLNPSPTEPGSLPARTHLDELHALSMAELLARMQELRVRIRPESTRHQLVADLLRFLTERGTEVLVDGVLEMASESH